MVNTVIEMQELSYKIRGFVLEHSTYIEKLMEYYIATYYCGETDKRDDFIETMLSNDVGFKAKMTTFCKIAKRNRLLLSKNKGLLDKINKIHTYRNCLAHELLDTSEPAIEYYKSTKEICFTKLYVKNKRTRFSESGMNELKELFEFVIEAIIPLLDGFNIKPFPKDFDN